MELWWVINSYKLYYPTCWGLSVYHNPWLGIPVNDFPSQEKSEGKKDVAAAPKRGDGHEKIPTFLATKMGTGTWTKKKLGMFVQRVWGDLTNGLGFHEQRVVQKDFCPRWRGGGFNQQKLMDYQATSDAGNTSNGVGEVQGWSKAASFSRLGLGINHQWFVLIWSILYPSFYLLQPN